MNIKYIETIIEEKSVIGKFPLSKSNDTYFNIIFLTIQIFILILQLGMIL